MLYPASAPALYLVLTRMLAARVSSHLLQFSSGFLGTVVLAPLGLWAWVQPSTGLEWSLALAIGAFAWAGHEVLTRAHRLAEASVLAPYGYSLVVFMMLAGWLVFGDIPTLNTLVGAALIVGAGLYVHRSQRC